jgi:hypothetical protein
MWQSFALFVIVLIYIDNLSKRIEKLEEKVHYLEENTVKKKKPKEPWEM